MALRHNVLIWSLKFKQLLGTCCSKHHSRKMIFTSFHFFLYTDPCLNPELYRLLLQFRLYPVAITADIETAYLQFNIEEEQRDYLRLLWFKNLLNGKKVKVSKYHFTRVTFGTTCFKYLLNATVYKHIQKYANIDIDFVKKVQRKFYVDD